MKDATQIRPSTLGRLRESKWFPAAVTVLAIVSVGAEIWGILHAVSALAGR